MLVTCLHSHASLLSLSISHLCADHRMAADEAELVALQKARKLDIRGQIRLKQLRLMDLQHNMKIEVLEAVVRHRVEDMHVASLARIEQNE